MSEYPSILLEQAVNQMASLPGIGRKTALRLVLHLLRQPEQDVQAFSGAFTRLKNEVVYCRADIYIRGKAGEVMPRLLEEIKKRLAQ